MRSRAEVFVRFPEQGSSAGQLARRCRGVLVSGPSVGGPAQLSGDLVELLIDVERRGLHIVLLAHELQDLDTPVAAVCRHVIAADPSTVRRARERWGVSQVVPVEALDEGAVGRALRQLPVPASRTLLRRLHSGSSSLRRRLRTLRQAGRTRRG